MEVPEARAPGALFLLTDYGTTDEFVGVVRAVLARLVPAAPLVDLTHDVAPFDVRAGALTLRRAVPHLGPGVVLGVVDPGVGTGRRAVALAVAGPAGPRALVGPDNGLLPWAADALGGVQGAVALGPPAGTAVTFDGRDVFAPAAAALWEGASPSSLGEPVDPATLVRLAPPRCAVRVGEVEAEVLWVDRFGNVQLAATAEDGARAGLLDAARLELSAAGREVALAPARAFAEVAGRGAPGLLVDANGHLALVCDRAPAATVLGVQPGESVVVRVAPEARP